MPIPLIAAGIGALGSLAGGAIGAASASGDREKQRQLMARILEEYGSITPPELERITANQLGPTAYEGVQGNMDPALAGDQRASLESLRSLQDQGGETAETRATMQRILGDVARQEAAGRNSIMSGMQARGVGGSGAELAAAMQNQSAQADRAQTAGMDQAAAAQRRMLDAAMQRGQLAGSIRGQEYGMQSDLARARDALSQYNGAERSKAQYYNAQLPAQQFGMQMQRAAGMSGALQGNAAAAGQAADRTAGMWAGIGNGVNQAATAYGDYTRRSQDSADQRDFLRTLWGSGATTPNSAATAAPTAAGPTTSWWKPDPRDTTDANGVPYYLAKP